MASRLIGHRDEVAVWANVTSHDICLLEAASGLVCLARGRLCPNGASVEVEASCIRRDWEQRSSTARVLCLRIELNIDIPNGTFDSHATVVDHL